VLSSFPANPLYTPPELQHQLADSGTTVVVTLLALSTRW